MIVFYFRFLSYLIVISAILIPVSFAGERSYSRFTTADGLAGNNVYGITQDRYGYIWIATETGLSRFDGSTFKNYTVQDGLPSNDISNLMIDKKGRLWIFPFKKAICYYADGKIYNRFNNALLGKLKVPEETKNFAEDEEGRLLYFNTEHMILIDTNDHLTYFPLIYKGKGFFKPEKLVYYLPASVIHPALQAYKMVNKTNTINEWYNALPAPDGRFYYSHSKQQLYIFRGSSVDTILLPLNRSTISLHQAATFIINTLIGTYLYNADTRQITDTLLTDVNVNFSFTDRDGSIWLGTNGRGLYYFPPTSSYNIRHRPGNVPIHAYHIYTWGDRLFAGVNNWGLWEIDKANKVLGKAELRDLSLELLRTSPGNIQGSAYRSILPALIREKMIDSVPMAKSFMSAGDTLIIADVYGLIYRVSLKTGKLIDSLDTKDRLICVYYKNGLYYVGTTEGLYIINPADPAIDPEHHMLLVKGSVNRIAFSQKYDLLWVSTVERGVYCLKNNKIVKHFDESNGLSSNICTSIFVSGDELYVGTVKGVNRISINDSFRIRVYGMQDGLLSNDINCIYTSGAWIIAGTPEGISFLNATVPDKPGLCHLHLDEVIVSGQKQDTSVTLQLDMKDNNIIFKYSGISFRSMGDIQYTYRLSGLDEDWQITDQNYLSYPNLPPGAYSLEIFATDRLGTRSATTRYPFFIRKAWWMHWWVKALGWILFSGGLGLLIWWRMSRLSKKERERSALKQKISSLEQLALRSQMNPHFIFNALNSFYQYIVSQDLRGASKFISDFSKLIRLLFETTALNETDLSTEIDFLSTYLEIEKVKLDHIFTYEFLIEEDMETGEFLIPTFILQPFIENAIRHGIQNRGDKKGVIKVAVYTENSCLVISIEDNGVGRIRAAQLKQDRVRIQQSKGITLTRERITLYNQSQQTDIRFKIEDLYKNGAAAGTLVIFNFPLKDIL